MLRIKMCTKVTMKDLITLHHEMAHIQYFLRYSGLPREFRDGANPGMCEIFNSCARTHTYTLNYTHIFYMLIIKNMYIHLSIYIFSIINILNKHTINLNLKLKS